MPIWNQLRVLSRSLSTRVSNSRVRNITSATATTPVLGESTANKTDLALNFTKHLLFSENVKAKNVVFSPLSLHVVLNIIANGPPEGPERDRMLSILGFESIDHLNSFTSDLGSTVLYDGKPVGGPHLNFAFGAWVDESLTPKPSFKQLLHTYYNAKLASLDFAKADEAAKEINSWTEKETNGLIKSIISPHSINKETLFTFTNALYFKGAWEEKFDEKRTRCYDFHLLNGTSTKTPFMMSSEKQIVSAFTDFKVLGLPYKMGIDNKRQFFMYIFLPNEKDGLPALIQKLCSNDNKSAFLESKLPRVKVAVGDFRIPKFKISFDFEANNMMNDLGFPMGGLLTEMLEIPEHNVFDIFQKSFIEVNEEGTEAAAVTGGFLSLGFDEISKDIDFVADHPFLFVIREEISGTLLFIGQVLNPAIE